jgi:hypothetical protein
MLVSDLMHEVEIGVWKALFTHLVRMMWVQGARIVQEFNARYLHD